MWALYTSVGAALLCSTATAISDEEFHQLKADIRRMQETQKSVIMSLARQVSQQQLYAEEMTRSYGDSGLKITRLARTGSRAYHSTSFSGDRVAAIHEHSNYRSTVGMGEFVAVLNGVEFRTRHNDYKMNMPSTTSSDYGATEEIPYPDVPPEVLTQPTVKLQMEEMREWFRAWQRGDYSTRDYRQYFKPNLCYLEGMWTNAKGGAIAEPFVSERHSIDAASFFDLQTKIRYTSVTGRKSTEENYAYLPTTISEIDDHGNIVYSQWNYNILCHPLAKDVPLTRFRLEDDLGVRVANGKTLEEFGAERAARFSLYPNPKRVRTEDEFTKPTAGSYLDSLMEQIPGKDNYPADIVDDFLGSVAYARNAKLPKSQNSNTSLPEPLNAGYYHRVYKVIGKDAMGVSIRRRGFSDNNLYVSYNTRSKVAAVKVKGKCKSKKSRCDKEQERAEKRCKKKRSGTDCKRSIVCPVVLDCLESAVRVSYAIPLEIIYATPLQTWNPWNLTFLAGKTEPRTTNISAGVKRNGGVTPETAYAGVNSRYYYLTPAEFYDSSESHGVRDPADTTKDGGVGVLDSSGVVRKMLQSGISIMTPNIPDIGPVRIRYPIMPLHDAGSTLYKDLQALTDLTLHKARNRCLYSGEGNTNGTAEEVSPSP